MPDVSNERGGAGRRPPRLRVAIGSRCCCMSALLKVWINASLRLRGCGLLGADEPVCVHLRRRLTVPGGSQFVQKFLHWRAKSCDIYKECIMSLR